MAKAQAVKPKSFLGGLFGGFGSQKAKPARPSAGQASTMTNLPAGGHAKGAPKAAAKPEAGGAALACFRLPYISSKPVTTQMQVLGTGAALLLLLTGLAVFVDTQALTRNATY